MILDKMSKMREGESSSVENKGPDENNRSGQ
jgi:hypothetical protein